MTDSPAFRAPLDPKEKPILDKLLGVRDHLLLLKQDKTKYVKSQDVNHLYDGIIAQVELLNGIRANKREEQNRVDGVLDDCLQLISLFFLTVGRTSEAPAAYSLVSNIKRLLDHLKEAAFYTEKDTTGLARRLSMIEDSIHKGKDKHSAAIITLLESRIAICRHVLDELQSIVKQLSPELSSVNEKLVSILRSLSGANTRSKFPVNEVHGYKEELKKMAKKFDGTELELTNSSASIDERLQLYADKLRNVSNSYSEAATLPGDAIVKDLLDRCLLWAEISERRKGKFDPKFKETFDHLISIRNSLEKLSLTQAWSLRETDLYTFQRKLDRVDESRVDGHFVDVDGHFADIYEQRTLLYLLRKSYATIYYMLTSSEPVSEALQPIYNQLTTLRKCLVEVKRNGGVSSPRELYPYSMKLNSIDNMRQDGKFVVNGDIPEGQGTLTSMLHECFEMAYELRNDAEDESDEESNEGGDDSYKAEPLDKLAHADTGVEQEAAVGLVPIMSRH